MAKWKCKLCGYIYDEEKGDLSRNVPAGTLFEDFALSYKCPKCGAGKTMFEGTVNLLAL